MVERTRFILIADTEVTRQIIAHALLKDCLCGLVVRVPGYRSRSRVEWGPISLVSRIEELLKRKSSGSGLDNRD
jgi:hypothetical protein